MNLLEHKDYKIFVSILFILTIITMPKSSNDYQYKCIYFQDLVEHQKVMDVIHKQEEVEAIAIHKLFNKDTK